MFALRFVAPAAALLAAALGGCASQVDSAESQSQSQQQPDRQAGEVLTAPGRTGTGEPFTVAAGQCPKPGGKTSYWDDRLPEPMNTRAAKPTPLTKVCARSVWVDAEGAEKPAGLTKAQSAEWDEHKMLFSFVRYQSTKDIKKNPIAAATAPTVDSVLNQLKTAMAAKDLTKNPDNAYVAQPSVFKNTQLQYHTKWRDGSRLNIAVYQDPSTGIVTADYLVRWFSPDSLHRKGDKAKEFFNNWSRGGGGGDTVDDGGEDFDDGGGIEAE